MSCQRGSFVACSSVDVKSILRYIIKKWMKDLDQTTIDGLAVYIDPKTKDEVMASVVQEWKVEDKAELLTELLEDHFVVLSKDVKDKISSANADTFRAWSKNIFKASNLDDVFKSSS